MALDLVARDVTVAGRRLSVLVPRSADEILDDNLDAGDTVPPYWADLWPSARALATHLLERGDLEGRRVLELGCGVGLPSLAALLAGAEVTASDVEPVAIRIAARNARRCARRRLQTLVVDVADPPPALLELPPFDLVIVADVLYRADLGDAFAALLPAIVAPTGEALMVHPFAGQGDAMIETLAARGWSVDRAELAVPDWLDGRTVVHAVRLRPAAA